MERGTLTNMVFSDILVILERPLPQLLIIIVIPLQPLSQQIQTMEMMKTFDVGGVSAAVLGVDADLIFGET